VTVKHRTLEGLLADQVLFRGVTPADLALIAGCGQNERFSAGDYLFREGGPADRFYLVRSGRVSLEVYVPARGAVVTDTIEPGGIAGLSWLFPPYRCQFDARAAEPVRAVGFDAVCLRDKCEQDPRLGYELMKRFAELLLERMQSARLRLPDVYHHA
jgi:CRP/FNR family transcriptional regulator, cyclic AMP receptor protein